MRVLVSPCGSSGRGPRPYTGVAAARPQTAAFTTNRTTVAVHLMPPMRQPCLRSCRRLRCRRRRHSPRRQRSCRALPACWWWRCCGAATPRPCGERDALQDAGGYQQQTPLHNSQLFWCPHSCTRPCTLSRPPALQACLQPAWAAHPHRSDGCKCGGGAVGACSSRAAGQQQHQATECACSGGIRSSSSCGTRSSGGGGGIRSSSSSSSSGRARQAGPVDACSRATVIRRFFARQRPAAAGPSGRCAGWA